MSKDYDNGFDRAQRAYENMMPLEDEEIDEDSEEQAEQKAEAKREWLEMRAEREMEEVPYEPRDREQLINKHEINTERDK